MMLLFHKLIYNVNTPQLLYYVTLPQSLYDATLLQSLHDFTLSQLSYDHIHNHNMTIIIPSVSADVSADIAEDRF